jgi:hypothetical protein
MGNVSSSAYVYAAIAVAAVAVRSSEAYSSLYAQPTHPILSPDEQRATFIPERQERLPFFENVWWYLRHPGSWGEG